MNDPRGSEWRKWDLHIHTPASFLQWKGSKTYRETATKTERDEITKHVIESINKSDVAAFAIQDYWTFDGYLEIRRFLNEHGEVSLIKTVFPGMELRVEAPTNFRLNIHILLSDQLTEQQLHDFKNQLRIRNIDRPMSDEALQQLAKTFDAGKARLHGFSDPSSLSEKDLLRLGSMTAEVSRDSLRNAMEQIPKNCRLIMLPYDTNDGIDKLDWKVQPQADNYFMQLADIFESRDANNIDLFLGRVTKDNKGFITQFIRTIGGKPKPAVSGSDAHRITDYGCYPSNRITWIKADPTFAGLLQLINEPCGRSFIGAIPPELARVSNNTTKYIRKISIRKKPDSDWDEEVWFDNEIEFNHGFVAVIGNKGNGKSALADIIGLLANSHRGEFFSFLNKGKFCNPNDNKNKAIHFEGVLEWESGATARLGLDKTSNKDIEKVRYIPQHFFERICNETEIRRDSEFNKELKKVIFSHVAEHARLGTQSLEELIAFQTEEIERTISEQKSQLRITNVRIAELETSLLPEQRKSIENQILQKEQELEAHGRMIPVAVEKPKEVSEVASQIELYREERDKIIAQRNLLTPAREASERRIVLTKKVKDSIHLFLAQYENLGSETADAILELGTSLDKLLNVQVDLGPLDTLLQNAETESVSLQTMYDELTASVEGYDANIAKLNAALETAHQAYQLYLSESEKWKQRESEIVGSEDVSGSIGWHKKKLADLSGVIPQKLAGLKKHREDIVRIIFSQIGKLADVYRSLFLPVQRFIENHRLVKNKYRLNFAVSIRLLPDFAESFFKHIKQNVTGTFQGKDEGRNELNRIIEKYNVNRDPEAIALANEILSNLENDMRDGKSKRKEVRIQDQLKGVSVPDFYDFLFSLDFIRPDYALKLEDKDLPQLSPGERGILLLIFYLLIDGDDFPLVIDQPEENLDNQSVVELLVPCVQEAKQKRQIFMITHNPNLAVVCDADQLIYVSIDKMDKNRVTYLCGAIENPQINKKIVDVLEGTWPALEKRESMYQKPLLEIGSMALAVGEGDI